MRAQAFEKMTELMERAWREGRDDVMAQLVSKSAVLRDRERAAGSIVRELLNNNIDW